MITYLCCTSLLLESVTILSTDGAVVMVIATDEEVWSGAVEVISSRV